MNSYTFNSKNKIISFFAIFLILSVITDLALYIYISKKTTKEQYIDELSSKTKHMMLNKDGKEVVFIGSSRTFYQINTNYFKDQGVNIYNYGISGRHTTNYAFMAGNAIKVNPKIIVINLDVEKLYEPISDLIDLPTISDINQFIISSQNIGDIVNAIIKNIKNTHLLNTYDTVIYEKIKQKFNKFTINKSVELLDELVVKKGKIEYDCEYFNVALNRGSHQHETLVKCKNGDGIIYGNYLDAPVVKEFKKYNEKHLDLYNSILDKINKSKIITITIFTPRYKNPYKFYNKKELLKNINSDYIIDMTDIVIPAAMWGDNAHLNIHGRSFYSKYIYQRIKSILEVENDKFNNIN